MLKQAQNRQAICSLDKAAERFLRRQVELEDGSPFHDAPTARAEHAARLSEAQVALREARAARMADAPRAAGREDVTSPGRGQFGDDELGQELVEALPRRGPDLGETGG